MSLTLQQLIDESVLEAKRGLGPDAFIDPLVAEALLPVVFQQVGVDYAKDERRRSLLRREKTLNFSNGTATISSDVLTQYKEDSLLYDPNDTTLEYSLCREWFDFVRSDDALLGRYSFNGATIAIIEAGSLYSPTAGTTDDRTLVIPCLVEIPASASTAITAPDEVTSDLVSALAEALKGAMVKAEAA